MRTGPYFGRLLLMSDIDTLLKIGAHFGYSRSRRHPSMKPYVYGVKNRTDILDVEKIGQTLSVALEFVKSLATEDKKILFVGNKNEAQEIVKQAAHTLSMPYVAGRWLGGTLTNFDQIKKRLSRLNELREKKTTGGLEVYTKRERAALERELEDLEAKFSSLSLMSDKLPDAVFLVDSNHEQIALDEAKIAGIPIISLSNSDCNISDIQYPIVANDSSVKSIAYFTGEIVSVYQKGLESKPKEKKQSEDKDE